MLPYLFPPNTHGRRCCLRLQEMETQRGLQSQGRAPFDPGSDGTKPMDILLRIAYSLPQAHSEGIYLHIKQRRRGAGKESQFSVSSALSHITFFTYLELFLNPLLS